MDKEYLNLNSVLFVDDEIPILNSLKRGLIGETYNKVFVTSGQDALRELKNKKFSVIVTDMRMPEMDGLKLLKIVNANYPDIIKIVLSGYTQLPQILATINQVNVFKFITKPWNMEDEFIPIIREAIEYYNFKKESESLKEALEKRNVLYQSIIKSTDQKFNLYKKDIEFLKKINRILIELFKKSLYNEKENLQIEAHENLFNELFLTLPSSYSQFSIADLLEEIKEQQQKHTDIIDIINSKISESERVNKFITANFKLLSCFIIWVIRSIYFYKAGNSFEFKFSTEDKSFNFIFIIKNPALTDDIESGKIRVEETGYFDMKILHEIAELLNGNLKIVKKDTRVLINLLVFTVSGSEG